MATRGKHSADRGSGSCSYTERKKVRYQKDPTVSNLPTEVLIKIFELFSVRERKNVKLVCRRWCEILHQTWKFLRDEKLICCQIHRSTNPSQDILAVLARTNREILNLDFHYFEFQNEDSSFWQQTGHRIRGLHFSECSPPSDALLSIISNCPNLAHLSWSLEKQKGQNVVLCTAETMDHLLSLGVTYPNLVSLHLHCSRANGLSNFILNGLFVLFPNIRKFGICYTTFEKYEQEEALVDSRTCLSLSCVLHKLKSLEDVAEKLNATLKYANERNNISWDYIINSQGFKKLKEVTFDVGLEKINLETIHSFFADRINLESVKLRGILGSLEYFFDDFCSHILDSCQKLRHIRVQSRAILLKAESFCKIVLSPLRTLHIQTPKLKIGSDSNFLREGQNLINDRLHTLVLDGDIGEREQILFVETFRHLHTLELRGTTDRVLQSIWKYQIHLVCLKLFRAYYTSDYGFSGIGSDHIEDPNNIECSYSIRRLEKLEYLMIESVEEEWSISGKTFNEFIFPRLRYLLFEVNIKPEIHHLMFEFTLNLRSLEALSLKFINASFQKSYDICGKLAHLRYLSIEDDSDEARKFTELQCERLFKRCPSLRALIHKYNDTYQTYFFHVPEKKITKKVPRRLHRLHSEKIGIFFVNDLWF